MSFRDPAEKKMVKKDIERKLNDLKDMVMQLDELKHRKEGLELIRGLRRILQLRGWMLDEIGHACEEAGLDEEEKKTVLDCITIDLYEHERVESST